LYNLTTTTGHLDVFKIIRSSNVIASSSHYDELMTKLHLHAMTEYEHNIEKQHLNLQKKEDAFHNQKKGKILLVDDEPDTCMGFQIVLKDAGYECVSYTDSVKALQDFRPNYYDLILLDIQMPGLNGFELCKKIRELDNIPHVIFITASEEYYEKFRSPDYMELVNNNGNTSYIQTPVGNKEFIQIVDMIMAAKGTT
jgi:CheY-like chemotaxis protein